MDDNVLNTFKYYLHDFWEEYGDNRVSHLPGLSGGPWHVLTITFLYVYFVKVVGPEIMRTRKPFDLRYVIILHNVLLVLINGIGFVIGVIGTQFGLSTLKCEPFDPRSKVFNDQLLFYLCYIFYISKFIDFLDTIYFVLRKKFSHITFLHLFHHSVMPLGTYVCFKFSTYTNNGFIPLINGFVHTIMYTYYAVAAYSSPDTSSSSLTASEKKSVDTSRTQLRANIIRWKKYITQIQLLQFVLVGIHSLYFFLDRNCNSSKVLSLFQVFQSVFFFHLFFSFYRRAYIKTKVSDGREEDMKSKRQ